MEGVEEEVRGRGLSGQRNEKDFEGRREKETNERRTSRFTGVKGSE